MWDAVSETGGKGLELSWEWSCEMTKRRKDAQASSWRS
jgi:hypothetical protein